MTTTAKILVVLNLLLAVLFLGFASASFNARLGMQTRITGLEKEKKSADDKIAVEKQAADKAELSSQENAKKLALEEKSRAEEKKQSTNTIDNMTSEMFGYKKQVDVTGQRIKQVTDESSQRKQEIDQARDQIKDLVAKNVLRENQLSGTRDEIQDLKSQIERLNDKMRLADEKHRNVLNWLASVKITLPSPDEMTNLPDATQPPAVEGIVKKVTDGGKLLTISLGENDNLRVGHRLQIFRTKPDARYIGMAEVTWTKPNEAVMRPVETYTAPPKEGDKVGISSMLHRGG